MANAGPVPPGGRGRLPVQTRDRRAALTALALLLVVAGALGSALVVYRNGHRTDVLVAAHEIKPGQQLGASDFHVARLVTDSGSVVRAADKSYLNSFATTDIPGGTLLNPLMFRKSSVLPPDGVVVGITLARNQRPATSVTAGDIVRCYQVPKSAQSGPAVPGTVLVAATRVVDVEGGSTDGTLSVSVLVSTADAPVLVTAASQDSVAVGELPKATPLGTDFESGR